LLLPHTLVAEVFSNIRGPQKGSINPDNPKIAVPVPILVAAQFRAQS